MLTDEIPLVTEVDKRRSWNLRGIHWRHFSVLGHHSIDKLSPRRGSLVIQNFALCRDFCVRVRIIKTPCQAPKPPNPLSFNKIHLTHQLPPNRYTEYIAKNPSKPLGETLG